MPKKQFAGARPVIVIKAEFANGKTVADWKRTGIGHGPHDWRMSDGATFKTEAEMRKSLAATLRQWATDLETLTLGLEAAS